MNAPTGVHTVTQTNGGYQLHFSGNRKFVVEKRDITAATTDFIVNAAKPSLTGGGGVDKAIHQAAGGSLKASCKKFKKKHGERCPTGQCRMTQSGRLQSSVVIHTVGPKLSKGSTSASKREKQDLYNTYETTLKEAHKLAKHLATQGRTVRYKHWPMDLTRGDAARLEGHAKNGGCTVTFPSISTGSYSFPKEKACQIATKAISNYFTSHARDPYIKEVHLTLPGRSNSQNFNFYKKRFECIQSKGLQTGLNKAHPK